MGQVMEFSSANRPTSWQQLIRASLAGVSFRTAVRRAAGLFFRFKYRAAKGRALWCGTQRVWMGSETFLYWSILDGQIDIPWVVADAPDAPVGSADLRKAVRVELLSYWQDQTARLPAQAKPYWLPLP